jgi:hypothetical protein
MTLASRRRLPAIGVALLLTTWPLPAPAQTGTLSATPNPCGASPCGATLSWTSTWSVSWSLSPAHTPSVQVRLGDQVVACGAANVPGSVAVSGVTDAAPRTYVLYAADSCAPMPLWLIRLDEVTVRTQAPQGGVRAVQYSRARLTAARGVEVPLAVTAMSYNRPVADPCRFNVALTPVEQAELLVDQFACAANGGAVHGIWFNTVDIYYPDDSCLEGLGILTPVPPASPSTVEVKPEMYAALQRVIAAVDGCLADPTRIEPETDVELCLRLGTSCGPLGGTDTCGTARTVASCGECTGFATCGGGGLPGQCGCTPLPCAAGVDCGESADGCGNVRDCGGCAAPSTCGGGGVANRCGCTPGTCDELGADCGQLLDGCGGTIDCGPCDAPLVCGTQAANQCGEGTCAPSTCATLEAQCGLISDGCAAVLDCGGCELPATCGGGGVANRCGSAACVPRACRDVVDSCGPMDDGCGNTLDCGPCATPSPSTGGCACAAAGDAAMAGAGLLVWIARLRSRRRGHCLARRA